VREAIDRGEDLAAVSRIACAGRDVYDAERGKALLY
jgi:hypothetical protein